jgi:hypothetical protein
MKAGGHDHSRPTSRPILTGSFFAGMIFAPKMLFQEDALA